MDKHDIEEVARQLVELGNKLHEVAGTGIRYGGWEIKHEPAWYDITDECSFVVELLVGAPRHPPWYYISIHHEGESIANPQMTIAGWVVNKPELYRIEIRGAIFRVEMRR